MMSINNGKKTDRQRKKEKENKYYDKLSLLLFLVCFCYYCDEENTTLLVQSCKQVDLNYWVDEFGYTVKIER